jgi:hypothetical protein
MEQLKIVITGSYAAGKTQFINSISEIETVNTDYETTLDEEKDLKTHTTVALDFGTITISDGILLYLFGTPGQERFDYMWEHLAMGCLGYIVMVDSCRPAKFGETISLMERFAQITDAPFLVAANKQDDPAALPPEYIRRRLRLPKHVPVLPCVARDRESVKGILLSLLEVITSDMTDAEKAS